MKFYDEIPESAGRERIYLRQQEAYEKIKLMSQPDTLGKWALVYEGKIRVNSYWEEPDKNERQVKTFLKSEAKLADKAVEFEYRYSQQADDPEQVWAGVRLFARVVARTEEEA